MTRDPSHPANWPFDEQRARERAANVAYPDRGVRTRQRNREWHTQVELAERRRAKQPRELG